MNIAQSATELSAALDRLETALLSPVVSGELESWAQAVQEAAAALAKELPAYLQTVLHPQYAQIAKSDQELLTRVQQLIDEDQKLIVEQEAFQKHVREFVQEAGRVKRDEVRAAGQRTKLEQEGIDLILHIKRQRAAADTWLAEAAYRDRGPVD